MKKISLVIASILIPSFGRCYDNYTMEKDIVLTIPLSQDVYSIGSNLQPQESIKGDLLIA